MYRIDRLTFATPLDALTHRLRVTNWLWWTVNAQTEDPVPYIPAPPPRLCTVCGQAEHTATPCLFGHQNHTFPTQEESTHESR